MKTKKCKTCLIDKPISDYYVSSKSKDGIDTICKECQSKRKKLFYINNKDKINARNRVWRENNPDKVKSQHINYYKDHKEIIRAKHKEYNEKNKDIKISYSKKYRKENRELINNKNKERLNNDELYKLTCLMRTSIRSNLKRNTGDKDIKTTTLLGCSFNELKLYIEDKWSLPCNLNSNGEVWMNWDNHGLYNGQPYYGWDIDHIIPLLPSLRTKEELLELFKYTNLQPLCSYINRCVKRDRLDFY